MGLVGNHGKALALGGGQLPHCRQCKGKGLNRANHDLLVTRQGLGQRCALAALGVLDGGHHAAGTLKIKQRLLQLGVDHIAVRHH